jgi:hypothetical protein
MSTGLLIGVSAVAIAALITAAVLVGRGSKPQARQRMCGGCRRVMLPQWDTCMFCGWAPISRIEFISGPLAGQVMPLTDEVTTLGSVAGNTIVLSDPAVSRKHLGIRRVGPHYELADLGSTNGVYVNGHRMPRKNLVSGDILRVGNTEMVFRRD